MSTHDFPGLDRFTKFVEERYSMWLKRSKGLPKPWTDDKILQNYRFCNVRREMDKVTIWIHENWLKPNKHDKDVWFAMCVARLINWPPTLYAIKYPVPYTSFYATSTALTMLDMKSARKKIYTAAYMVRSEPMPKTVYLCDRVFQPLWDNRNWLRPKRGEPLENFHKRLIECRGMGSFLAAQVVADVKWALPFIDAPDWQTFVASGPGSQRGLNRVMCAPAKQPWQEQEWRKRLLELRELVNAKIQRSVGPLDAQNVQNCLCEFDKYERARLGEGTPKQSFQGASDENHRS